MADGKLTIVFDTKSPERKACMVGDICAVVDLGEALDVGPNHRRFGVLCAGKLRRVPGGWYFHVPPPFQILCEEKGAGEFAEIVPES